MTFANRSDTTTGNLRIEGSWENNRNHDRKDLFRAMIHEAYGAEEIIIAHHLTYVAKGKAIDKGREFEIEVVEELPSADTFIFDHVAAQKLWGSKWKKVLTKLALTPVELRDKVLAELYYNR